MFPRTAIPPPHEGLKTMTIEFNKQLVDLAILSGIGPKQAVALPTVIEVAARKSGMTEKAMLAEAKINQGLRDYFKRICTEVTA